VSKLINENEIEIYTGRCSVPRRVRRHTEIILVMRKCVPKREKSLNKVNVYTVCDIRIKELRGLGSRLPVTRIFQQYLFGIWQAYYLISWWLCAVASRAIWNVDYIAPPFPHINPMVPFSVAWPGQPLTNRASPFPSPPQLFSFLWPSAPHCAIAYRSITHSVALRFLNQPLILVWHLHNLAPVTPQNTLRWSRRSISKQTYIQDIILNHGTQVIPQLDGHLRQWPPRDSHLCYIRPSWCFQQLHRAVQVQDLASPSIACACLLVSTFLLRLPISICARRQHRASSHIWSDINDTPRPINNDM